MAHDHSHHIGNSAGNYNRAYAIGVLLNVAFVVIEAGYGLVADSMALIADAGHNLSDVLSLLLAWGASVLAAKAATEKRTYGFRKATILASLVSAVLLLLVLGGIAWEAIGRLFAPKPVAGMVVITVAAIGVVINTATALLFISGQKQDLNIRGAFLHMAADAAVSLGVVVAGAVMLYTDWLLIDPVVTLLIVAVVLVSAWTLFRDSSNLAMDSVPEGIDMAQVRKYLTTLENVAQIHDLHVWPMSTTEVALSVHLMMTTERQSADFLNTVQQQLHDRFGIEHSTIQIERQGDEPCLLDRHECI